MSADQLGKLTYWNFHQRGSDGSKIMRDGHLRDSRLIYHMLPWPYAKMIFKDRRLRLSPVGSWTDPYEKWWCNILFRRTGALSGLQAYGLCWTTGTHDEPRWRMAAFRKDDPIVRIRSRVDAILRAGRNLIGSRPGSMFLGKVQYKHQKSLVQLAQSVTAGTRKEVTRVAASMLLQKRMAFKFEDEVRLLWLDRGQAANFLYLEIDPVAVIDQVMTSPYVTPAEHGEIAAYLLSHGLKPIRSSILQEPPGL